MWHVTLKSLSLSTLPPLHSLWCPSRFFLTNSCKFPCDPSISCTLQLLARTPPPMVLPFSTPNYDAWPIFSFSSPLVIILSFRLFSCCRCPFPNPSIFTPFDLSVLPSKCSDLFLLTYLSLLHSIPSPAKVLS